MSRANLDTFTQAFLNLMEGQDIEQQAKMNMLIASFGEFKMIEAYQNEVGPLGIAQLFGGIASTSEDAGYLVLLGICVATSAYLGFDEVGEFETFVSNATMDLHRLNEAEGSEA